MKALTIIELVLGAAAASAGASLLFFAGTTGPLPLVTEIALVVMGALLLVAGIRSVRRDAESSQRRHSSQSDEERAAARLAALVEHSDDAILATDSAGMITDWNAGAQKLFGYTAAEAIGGSVDLLTPLGRAGVTPDVISAANPPGRTHRYETSVQCKDGSQAYIAFTISPVIDLNGKVSGASIVAKDMTLRHRAENAIHSAFIKEKVQAEKGREAVEHFRKLDLMKDEFLSTVAHEIKTPLVLVIGFAETLSAHWQRLDDESRELLLKKISLHTREGSRMVEQLLDLTRLEAGIQLRLSKVSLQDTVEGLLDRLGALLTGRTVTTDLPDVGIQVDVYGFERVFTNLVVNAAKYSPEGTPIHVSARIEGEGVEISVIDQGPGIAPEEKDLIFRQFYRSKFKSTNGVGGWGVGLSITLRYVELHEGRIWVDDREGGGSAFKFTLPYALSVDGVRS